MVSSRASGATNEIPHDLAEAERRLIGITARARGGIHGRRRARVDMALHRRSIVPGRRRTPRACYKPCRMAEPRLMDRMFQRIMRGLVETGRAPHYAELARALGRSTDEGRLILHDVMQAYPIGWRHPETDYISSFPLLLNPPAHYRLSARGEPRSCY